MRRSAKFAAMVAGAALAFGLASPAIRTVPEARAQNLGMRTINGRVLDANSAAVQGATVFLRDTKTKSIRSYTSGEEGKFRFAQVNIQGDFDLWAEKDGRKSPVKSISSWDSRKEVEAELKLK
jgi:hypothetical protein